MTEILSRNGAMFRDSAPVSTFGLTPVHLALLPVIKKHRDSPQFHTMEKSMVMKKYVSSICEKVSFNWSVQAQKLSRVLQYYIQKTEVYLNFGSEYRKGEDHKRCCTNRSSSDAIRLILYSFYYGHKLYPEELQSYS